MAANANANAATYDTLRWICEERQEISAADEAALQELLERHPPRFAPDIRDVLRWRLKALFESVSMSGDARAAAKAATCLLRFDDTDVETLQRCAAALNRP